MDMIDKSFELLFAEVGMSYMYRFEVGSLKQILVGRS